MKIADMPPKFDIPFANAAGGGYITYPLPETSQIGITAGRASLETGFPPVNFSPVGAGGTPPFGEDMNGLLKQITLWNQWNGAGGVAAYDSAFSTAIGGYPKGAILSSTTAGLLWLCVADDNTTNPDSGGSNWVAVVTPVGVQNQTWSGFTDTGTADALVITPVPANVTNVLFQKWVVKKTAAANATTSPTLKIGAAAAAPLKAADGSALGIGALPAGCIFEVAGDGTNFRVTSVPSPASIVREALFPYFKAINNTNFTGPNGVETGLTGYAAAVGDAAVVAGFNPADSTFTCPTGFSGLWLVQGYLNSLTSGATPSNGYGTRIRSNGTLVSAATSPASTVVQGSVVAIVNLAAGDTAQLTALANNAGVAISYFYMTAVRLGRTS